MLGVRPKRNTNLSCKRMQSVNTTVLSHENVQADSEYLHCQHRFLFFTVGRLSICSFVSFLNRSTSTLISEVLGMLGTTLAMHLEVGEFHNWAHVLPYDVYSDLACGRLTERGFGNVEMSIVSLKTYFFA